MNHITKGMGILLLMMGMSNHVEAQKVYRWVDKDGKVQYGHSIPPEYAGVKHDQFSTKSGLKTQTVDEAPSQEELDEEKAKIKEAEALAETKKLDQQFLDAYPELTTLTAFYGNQRTQNEEEQKAMAINIKSIEKAISDRLQYVAKLEREGKTIPKKETDILEEMARNLKEARLQEVALKTEFETIQYEAQLQEARWKTLKEASTAEIQ